MFTAATGVPPERGPGFEAGAWRKGNVAQNLPAVNIPKKTIPRMTGANTVGIQPLFGGTRRKGGKRSKTRRLSKKRRLTRRRRQGRR
jgi:hypothetical protein